MFKGNPTLVRTVEVRLSYAHIFQPYSQDGTSEPKYSAALLLPKTATACYNEIMQAIEAAKQEGIRTTWKGACPPNPPLPIHDGDGVRERSGEPYGEECKGCYVISAKSKNKPDIVHQSNIQCLLPEGSVKSGDYAQVTINFYAYDANGNRGIACGLGNIMITRDGEPLGGRSTAASDFADLESSYVPQETPVQSPYPSAPPQNYAQAAPPQNYAQAAPPQNYAQTAPPQNYGQAVPSQNYAQAAPQQGYAQAAPQQGYAQTAPSQGYGQAVPQQGYGQPAAPDAVFDPNVYMNGGYPAN